MHQTINLNNVGSIPTVRFALREENFYRGVAQSVERKVPNFEVAGSIPVTPFTFTVTYTTGICVCGAVQ